jgi:hypothetical protein
VADAKRRERPKTGRRSDERYVQANFLLPRDLVREFKARAVLEGRDMSEIVEGLLRTYVSSRK